MVLIIKISLWYRFEILILDIALKKWRIRIGPLSQIVNVKVVCVGTPSTLVLTKTCTIIIYLPDSDIHRSYRFCMKTTKFDRRSFCCRTIKDLGFINSSALYSLQSPVCIANSACTHLFKCQRRSRTSCMRKFPYWYCLFLPVFVVAYDFR